MNSLEDSPDLGASKLKKCEQYPTHRRILTRKPERLPVKSKTFNNRSMYYTPSTTRHTLTPTPSEEYIQRINTSQIEVSEFRESQSQLYLSRLQSNTSRQRSESSCSSVKGQNQTVLGFKVKIDGFDVTPEINTYRRENSNTSRESKKTAGQLYERELCMLRHQIYQLKKENQQLRMQKQRLEDSNTSKTKLHNQLQIRLRAKEVADRCARPCGSSQKFQQLHQQLLELRSANTALQDDNSNKRQVIQLMQNKIEAMNSKLKDMKSENQLLKQKKLLSEAQITELQNRLSVQQSQMQHINQRLHEALAQVQYCGIQIHTLKQKIGVLQKIKLENQEKTYLSDQNKKLRVNNLQLRKRINGLASERDKQLFCLSPE